MLVAAGYGSATIFGRCQIKESLSGMIPVALYITIDPEPRDASIGINVKTYMTLSLAVVNGVQVMAVS